jgi:hypothetical protein
MAKQTKAQRSAAAKKAAATRKKNQAKKSPQQKAADTRKKGIKRDVGRHPFAPGTSVGVYREDEVAGTGGEPKPNSLKNHTVSKDGSLEVEVPKKGRYVIGGEVEIDNGAEKVDQEMIDYLRQHDLFLDGSEPQLREALIAGRKSRGFYEAYDANRPNVEERLMQIADFAADGELEGLQAIVADETSFGDGGREQVLDSARNQIVKIEERQRIIQKIEADAEADAESEPPEGGTPSEDNEGTDDARDSGD